MFKTGRDKTIEVQLYFVIKKLVMQEIPNES